MKKEKTFKRLCRYCCLTALLLGFSATAFADAMKNNPIMASGLWGDVLGGTTFSAANNSEQTSFTSLEASEICWNRMDDALTMASAYGYVTNTSYGTASSPKYRITNGSNSGYASKLDATTNYFIFHAPKPQKEIATFSVKGYKPNTEVIVCFSLFEVSGKDKTKIKVSVNNFTEGIEIASGGVKEVTMVIPADHAGLNTNKLTIKLSRDNYNEGDNCVLAISDFYVYGLVVPLAIETDKKQVEWGETITLSAVTGTGLDLSKVQWKKSSNGGLDYNVTLGNGATITDEPSLGKNYYRAEYMDDSGQYYISEPIMITAILACSDEASVVLFEENFGQLDEETARNEGDPAHINVYGPNNPDGYVYVGDCGFLKDEGTYAVMANPRYGGCNLNNISDGCDCTNAKEGEMWYRDIMDKTQGGVDENGKYGGMLMVNGKASLVYSRQVNVSCSNTMMNFSAWFASASGPMPGIEDKYKPISMQFVVKDENGNIIEDATLVVKDIDYSMGWVKGETSFDSGDNSVLTVEIYNYQEGGQGNDFLVDDIRFTVCAPKVDIQAYSRSNDVIIDNVKKEVPGLCEEAVSLEVDASMAMNLFDNPYYVWFKKSATEEDFTAMLHWNGKMKVDTLLTEKTEYYAMVMASPEMAEEYLSGYTDPCEIVGVTPIMNVSCQVPTPISIELVSRVCNTITLRAIAEEGIEYTWQKSTDAGQNWEDIDYKGSEYTVTITEKTMFRIKNADSNSQPTSEFLVWSVELTTEPAEISLGDEVTLSVEVIGIRKIDELAWYANGKSIEVEGTTYTTKPYATTEYMVMLEGCESNAVVATVVWPTVFTPLLVDGFNDDFVMGMNPAVALKIYDRYGNLLVETADGWDGKDSNGNYAMPGVYYYVAVLSNGEVAKGNVELLNEKR